jgi:hypothetical protein
MCLSTSGCKLKSWNFACPCFARSSIKLRTQVWNFLELSWKILKFSSKMVINLSKSIWVEARELQFCMNELFNNVFKVFFFFTCPIWNMRELLVSCREKWKKKIIAEFHVLGPFMAKKHDLSEFFFSVCQAPRPLPSPPPPP